MRKIKQLTNSMELTLKFLVKRKTRWCTTKQVATAAKCAERTARMYLEFLAETGVLHVRVEAHPVRKYKIKSRRKLELFIATTPRIHR